MARNRPARLKRPGILLSCEGRECEPNYFDALARDKGLTNLIIPRDDVSDPMSLVGIAAEGLRRDKFVSQAFAVFDTYEHQGQGHAGALNRANQIDPTGDQLAAYPSYPSFEYWLLLHYEMTRAPMNQHEALARLKVHVPHYEKNSAEAMDEIVERVDEAIVRAEKSCEDAEKTGHLNSSTTVHRLVIRLLT